MKSYAFAWAMLLALISSATYGQNLQLDTTWWRPNGQVNDLVIDTSAERVYIAGGFSRLYPNGGDLPMHGSQVDLDGNVKLGSMNPDADVWAAEPDGNGGWYIGGAFTMVGDSQRANIAHVDSNGQVLGDITKGFDYRVNSLLKSGDTLYVGGRFTTFDDAENIYRNGVLLDTSLGAPVTSPINPDNRIMTAVSDGQGGFFIGGFFTSIGDSARSRIAQIDSNGNVTSWSLDANNSVYTLRRYDSILFIAGYFSWIGGESRSRVAAYNINTGEILDWHPGYINSLVRDVVLDDTVVYLGGQFSQVNSVDRKALAAVSWNSGALLDWNPDVYSTYTAQVYTLLLDDTTLYFGGFFDSVNSVSHPNLAAVSRYSGELTSFSGYATGQVRHLEKYEDSLVVGGSFYQLNGQYRYGIGSYDLTTGNLNDWTISCSGIENFTIVDDYIYAVGGIGQIAGQPRVRAGKFKYGSSFPDPWDPSFSSANSYLNAVASNGSRVYIGGYFANLGTVPGFENLAAIDLTTGDTLNWPAYTNAEVYDLALKDSSVFVAGNFSYINGVYRRGLGKVHRSTGALNSWYPNVNSAVYDIEFNGSRLYAAGAFSSIGGSPRGRIAAFDATSLALLSWDPNANYEVYAIKAHGNSVYATGYFASIGGEMRARIAQLSPSTGLATSWSPELNSAGRTIYAEDGIVYVGGYFSEVNGVSQRAAVALDSVNGEITSWQPRPYGHLQTIEKEGDYFYLGGYYSEIGSFPANRIAALDLNTGEPIDWIPNVNSTVNSVALGDSTIYIGGYFTQVNGESRNRIAELRLDDATVTSWDPNANNSVFSMEVKDSILYACGYFNYVGGQPIFSLASINRNTGVASDLGLSLNSYAYGIKVVDSLLFIGGDFQYINSNYRPRLVAYDLNSDSLLDWSPEPNSRVRSFEVAHEKLFVGGNFSSINGTPRGRIASFNLDSLELTALNANLNGDVYSLSSVGQYILAGGFFSTINSTPRTYAGSFHYQNGTVGSWNPSLNSGGYAIEAHGNKVVLGGGFSTISNTGTRYVAPFDLDCSANSGTESLTVCGSYFWEVTGQWLDSTGIYVGNTFNIGGCDSVVTLNLTINQPDSSTEVITACNSYTWSANSTTYTTSGIYEDSLLTVNGCDSLVTLDLTINYSDSSSITTTVCDSYTWVANNQTYTSSGYYIDTLSTALGCDSIVSLDLTVNYTNSSFDTVIACDSYFWNANNQTITTSGVYVDTLTNMTGCDSIVTLDLTVNYSNSSSDTVTSCDSYTWSANGSTITTSGVYVDTLTNMTGCDSVVTLDLTVLFSDSTSEDVTVCDSYTWSANGTTYTTSGSYVETLTNQDGCDSVATLNLTVHYSDEITEEVTACFSYEWSVTGITYTSSGLYTDTLSTSNGCDSVVNLDLTIDTVDVGVSLLGFTLTASAQDANYQWLDCLAGTSLLIGETGQSYTATEDGEYAVEVNQNGCVDTSMCYEIIGTGLELVNNDAVSLFPNPTTGAVTISLAEGTSANTIIVRDALGKIVQQVTDLDQRTLNLEIQGTAGIYFIEVRDGAAPKAFFKVIKQ